MTTKTLYYRGFSFNLVQTPFAKTTSYYVHEGAVLKAQGWGKTVNQATKRAKKVIDEMLKFRNEINY